MLSFLTDLQSYLLLAGPTPTTLQKTDIGKQLFEYRDALEIEDATLAHFICFIYSRLYKCDDLMIRYIALSVACQRSFSSIFTRSSINRSNISKHTPRDNKSDIMYMLSVLDNINRFLTSHNIPTDLDTDLFYNKFSFNG
jgi:hypothetical protein